MTGGKKKPGWRASLTKEKAENDEKAATERSWKKQTGSNKLGCKKS